MNSIFLFDCDIYIILQESLSLLLDVNYLSLSMTSSNSDSSGSRYSNVVGVISFPRSIDSVDGIGDGVDSVITASFVAQREMKGWSVFSCMHETH